MNTWLYKLERKFGRFCITNLMMYITATMGLVYLVDVFTGISRYMTLIWSRVLGGEIWRVITFAAIPPTLSTYSVSPTDLLWLVIGLMVYYFIGTSLENAMGSFSFNVYYLCGIISAVLAAAISGTGTNSYLNLSLLFAFAVYFPDTQFRIFFLIPIKVKHLAMIDAALFAISFLISAVAGDWAGCLAIVASLLNFFLFFGPDFIRKVKNNRRYASSRKQFRKDLKNNDNNFWR